MRSWSKNLFILIPIGMLLTTSLHAQIKDSAYRVMLESIYSKTVPLIDADSLNKVSNKVIILDTRQKEEYQVSHIKNARWVGYKSFQKKAIQNLPKDTPIVVHCSVGYRSEKIGEKLQKMGYQNVSNLYGGIFEWINRGYPVYKNDSTPTNDIHPYSQKWGIWLDQGNKVYK